MKNKFHRQILITAINLLLIASAYTQDLSGYWQGVFVSDLDSKNPGREFFLNMVIYQNGRKIEGRFSSSYMDSRNQPNVVYEISGELGKKDKIPTRLIAGRILHNTLPGTVAEAFQQFDDIRYFKNDSMEVLYGVWTGGAALRRDGISGSFRVRKLPIDGSFKNKEADNNFVKLPVESATEKADSLSFTMQMAKRINSEQGYIMSTTKSITLSLYDNGIVDDDSVSIFFNGRLLRMHQRVSEKPIVLNIELDERVKRNEIVLFAENTGTISPNTALVVVAAGNKRYEFFPKASLDTNAVLVFEYKPDCASDCLLPLRDRFPVSHTNDESKKTW